MRKTAIVGVGAIGSVMGAYMAHHGADVTLIDQWKEHVRQIQQHGLQVEGPRGKFHTPVQALLVDELDHLDGKLKLVFLVVKSVDTERMARLLLPYLSDDAWVVSVQNGFNEERLIPILGRERVLGAIITISAELLVPGKVVEHSGLGQALLRTKIGFVLGEVDGRITPRLEEIAKVLELCSPVRITTELLKERWTKTVINCLGNPTEAITGFNSWDTRSNPLCRRLMIHLGAEAARVAIAAGYRPDLVAGIPPEELIATVEAGNFAKVEAELLKGTDTKPAYPAISSMLQDILRGRKTEIDYLTGYVVAKGKSLGMPTPVNQAMIAMIKEMEQGKRKPSAANLEVFRPLLKL